MRSKLGVEMDFRRITSSFLMAGCLLGCASSRAVAKKEEKPLVEKAVVQDAAPVADPLERGYALETAEQWPEAIAFYAGVLKQQPANATAMHRLAVIATLREDHEAAASYYRRAMELDPRNATLLADAGYFLSLQKQYDTASLMLQQALLLEPENERVINNLAMVQGLRGESDVALMLFRRVNPPAVALQNVASIHEQRGEWQLALACYIEARSVDPQVTIPEDVLAKVDELRQGPAVAELTAEASPVMPPVTTTVVPQQSHPTSPKKTVVAPANVVADTVEETEADFFPADYETVEEELVDVGRETNITPVAAVESAEESSVTVHAGCRQDVVLDGCCPVALRDGAQVLDGQPEFLVKHRGMTYFLSSADAVKKFHQQPERYVPSAGGLDVVSVRSGRMERGSLTFSTWFRNRLFLFTSADHVDEFRSDPLRYTDLD